MADTASEPQKRDRGLVGFQRSTAKLDLDHVRDFMADRKLGAIVPFSPANIAYTTNFYSHGMFIINHERDMLERPQPVLLPDGELVLAAEQWGDAKRRMAVLARLLEARGLSAGCIGVDLDYAPATCCDELRRLLPGLRIENVTPFFWGMRSVKTDAEIGFIRAAVKAQEAGADAILEIWRAGVSMDDVRRRYVETVMAHGAINAYGGVCNRLAVLDAWQWHDLPQRPQHVVRANDEWDLDFHPHDKYQGYYAGMAMNVYAGDPPSHVRESSEYRWRAQDVIVSQVKAGMSQSEVFHACRDALQAQLGEYSWGYWQWFIHGIGLTLHEQPMVGTLSGDYVMLGNGEEPVRFQDGMVMAVESGFGVEQLYEMRDGRLHPLHNLPRRLICV